MFEKLWCLQCSQTLVAFSEILYLVALCASTHSIHIQLFNNFKYIITLPISNKKQLVTWKLEFIFQADIRLIPTLYLNIYNLWILHGE
jgi:hypothetical protein